VRPGRRRHELAKDDYAATCKDGNKYRLYMNAEGRWLSRSGSSCERLTSARPEWTMALWVGRARCNVAGPSSPAASAQALSTLHVTVTLADATGKITPVARHALLISDEPPTKEPRRILTTLAGTADITLRPGRYAVESDQPVAFEGKRYEWSQRIDVVAA